MTDIELVRRCAEAMVIPGASEIRPLNKSDSSGVSFYLHGTGGNVEYNPLTDDAQAMALVKKFWMVIEPPLRDSRAKNKLWYVNIPATEDYSVQHGNLNRAIVECVAKMKAAE